MSNQNVIEVPEAEIVRVKEELDRRVKTMLEQVHHLYEKLNPILIPLDQADAAEKPTSYCHSELGNELWAIMNAVNTSISLIRELEDRLAI